MSLRNLPTAAFDRPAAYHGDARSDALAQWKPLAAEADEPATLSIYDQIGEDDWDGTGWTARRVAGILRAVGPKAVTVNINSPGGDMFEGLAIYNLLREHPAAVTVKVMGVAASAASIVAMAGDRIEMGLGSIMMIHNSWGMVVGDQTDMLKASETFAEFDRAMAEIYADRTGIKAGKIADMMTAETWIRSDAAIEFGFADATFADPEYKTDKSQSARAALESTLAKAGMPRSERRRLLREATGMPGAAAEVTPSADFDAADAMRLITTMKSIIEGTVK